MDLLGPVWGVTEVQALRMRRIARGGTLLARLCLRRIPGLSAPVVHQLGTLVGECTWDEITSCKADIIWVEKTRWLWEPRSIYSESESNLLKMWRL